jgi:hypothetical protein
VYQALCESWVTADIEVPKIGWVSERNEHRLVRSMGFGMVKTVLVAAQKVPSPVNLSVFG